MNVSFPLRDGHFRPLQCTPAEARKWKQHMVDLLHQTLQEETPYSASQYTFIDTKRWKPLKEKDRIRTYQPRRSLLGRGSAQSVLAVGTLDGSLEDVIYGLHNVATPDMRATTDFLRESAIDGAVLHVFENGTPTDPFRSLAVKWRVVHTPGGSLVTNRDGCVLEYMGIDYDAKGQRYAFHISDNFEHAACPPFSAKCAVRAKAHTRILFRQVSHGRVGMYFKGDFGLGGKLPGALARRSAAELALGISRAVACTEAKKLTALALATSPLFHQQGVSFLPTLSSVCAICSAKPGFLSTKSMTWCKVCGGPVCSKCKSRKYLFSDDKKIRISCCKQCLVAAKQLLVDPTRPLPLVPAGQWMALMASQTQAFAERGLDQSYVSTSDSQSTTERSVSFSTYDGSSLSMASFDAFDSQLTPLSVADVSEPFDHFDEPVAVLECSDMSSVLEEDEDDIPTLGELPWSEEFRFNRKISLDDDIDLVPRFARSAFTPSVAKSEEQSLVHCEADRMSLYSQMRRLREQAENAFSMTQANGWEYMTPKASTSSASSMASTAAWSSSSHASSTFSHTSVS